MWRILGRRGEGDTKATAPEARSGILRAPHTTVSLDWLLGLTGSLEDEAPSSIRFRENIESPNIKLVEVETWVQQALTRPREDQRLLALQDLVNSIGKRLGFGVTYGRYVKTPDDWLGFDGLWRIEHDLFATVDVYSLRLEGIDFSGLGAAAQKLRDSNILLGKSDIVHVFVLSDDYLPQVEDDIRRSDFHSSIRLLPLSTLFEILRMRLEGVVTPPQLPFFFRSYEAIGIHNLVLFLEQFIAAHDTQPPSLHHQPHTGTDFSRGLHDANRLRERADMPPSTLQAIIGAMDSGEVGPNVLRDFVSSHPDDLRAAEYLGDLFCAQGEIDEAIQVYERALDTAPNDEPILLKLVSVLTERKDHERALSCIERTSPRIPRGALEIRAKLLLWTGRPKECRAACESLIEDEGHRPDIYRLMGLAFESEQALAEAMACFEKAIQLSPTDMESKRRLAVLRKTKALQVQPSRCEDLSSLPDVED